jgi:hypothetical protein
VIEHVGGCVAGAAVKEFAEGCLGNVTRGFLDGRFIVVGVAVVVAVVAVERLGEKKLAVWGAADEEHAVAKGLLEDIGGFGSRETGHC